MSCREMTLLYRKFGQINNDFVPFSNAPPSLSTCFPITPHASPLDRVLYRGSDQPWERVGYVVSAQAQSDDRTMALFAQPLNRRRNRYNYRVVDRRQVPLDVGEDVVWWNNDTQISVPGQNVMYTVHLYECYR